MRILIATYVPLQSEQGSPQIAMELGSALQKRGHEVVFWCSPPRPRWLPWWHDWGWKRRQLLDFVERQYRLDVLDVQPTAASKKLRRAGFLVVRSVQPELEYLRLARLTDAALPLAHRVLHRLHERHAIGAIEAGWRAADLILCLGAAERRWMIEHRPRLSTRLARYDIAPPDSERSELRRIARERRAPSKSTRWLWIGRWTPHKGTNGLCQFIAERLAGYMSDRITLAGCGSIESQLPAESLATGRLTVVPFFERSRLPQILAEHDAGLFTSISEGWGLSLHEMLEAGLTVYATEAGAVEDLRPYFPNQLRMFPPRSAPTSPAAPDDLTSTDYWRRFSWAEIAERYEADVLRAGAGGRR